jgi:ubiquinone/menaquinone biosynthesis C-methylase UbiE
MGKSNTSIQPIRFDRVADLYDHYVTADFDINFFLNEAKRIGGKVLELACGTGRVSIPLLRAATDLTCIDYAEKMLEVFRKKLIQHQLPCNIIRMDMTRLAFRERFDLIFIPFHSFSEVIDTSKHLPTLRLIYKHLADHGRVICTLQNPVVQIKSHRGEPRTIGTFQMDSGKSLIVKVYFTYDSLTQIVHGYQLYEISPYMIWRLKRRV